MMTRTGPVAILRGRCYAIIVRFGAASRKGAVLVDELRDTVAVVTGASRGLGKGMAVGLGERGATVYVTGRSTAARPGSLPGTVEQTAEAVTAAGGHGIAVAVDQTVDGEVAALFGRVVRDHGRIDVLVNCA